MATLKVKNITTLQTYEKKKFSDIMIGDFFLLAVPGATDELFLKVGYSDSENNAFSITDPNTIPDYKITDFDETVEVFPVDVEINYSKILN